METYFNIRYEMNKETVLQAISQQVKKNTSTYICVVDGVVLNIANRDKDYLTVVNASMFSICDSGYVPIYLKWIYGIEREQYCGSQIFVDIIKMKKYRMLFMGTSVEILTALKENLKDIDGRIADMTFLELPFCSVEQFNYKEIADKVNIDGADIIWVALGAPKQEFFMSKLQPYLNRGVMIAVGAVFKFYSGIDAKRAPQWMINNHLEFVYRIFCEPQKQLKRCSMILLTLPKLLIQEIQCKIRR